MRPIVTGCALAMAAALTAPLSADAQALSGQMAPFSYLVGAAWNCTTNVPAMGGQPAHTDQGTATFEVVPGNVVHNHVATPNYSGDFYFGYSTRMSSFWQTSADSVGGHSFLTSTDGKSYTGTTSMGPMNAQDTVTYTRAAPNKVMVHEVVVGSGPQAVFDSVCTR
ncbi:MAG: hypothetical protein JO190_08560 [Candidatus Eremiobacteraeota bacterium]|nr:hypothetical protein [Candidatus Eremiobacteraeota bacterium]MBV8498080.1 hypothetical protein [Candidatus Eremiobacteraeota bacterium]